MKVLCKHYHWLLIRIAKHCGIIGVFVTKWGGKKSTADFEFIPLYPLFSVLHLRFPASAYQSSLLLHWAGCVGIHKWLCKETNGVHSRNFSHFVIEVLKRLIQRCLKTGYKFAVKRFKRAYGAFLRAYRECLRFYPRYRFTEQAVWASTSDFVKKRTEFIAGIFLLRRKGA